MHSKVGISLVFVAGLLLGAFAAHSLSSSKAASEHSQSARDPTIIDSETRAGARTTADAADAEVDAAKPAQTPQQESGGGAEAAASPSLPSSVSNPLTHTTVDDARYASTPKRLFSSGENVKKSSSESGSSDDRAKLHDAYRVICQFDPGYSALIGADSITTAGANWQGGQIIYDVIDADTGRATMSGTAGATGSNTGTAEVQMLKSSASLSFSGVLPSGDLIVTTVFTRRNPRGEFLAVMSTHAAANGHVASQFYGACDVR